MLRCSPRNHMVFTPLLPSACVGTVEPRSVAVPIISLQKAFSRASNMLYTATATAVRPDARAVDCVSESGDICFTVNYDKLVITTGSQGCGPFHYYSTYSLDHSSIL